MPQLLPTGPKFLASHSTGLPLTSKRPLLNWAEEHCHNVNEVKLFLEHKSIRLHTTIRSSLLPLSAYERNGNPPRHQYIPYPFCLIPMFPNEQRFS